jgi:peptide/nickel transport system permease protein
MFRLLLRRLRDLVVVLVLVGTAMFFIIRAVPGGPAAGILGEQATPDQIEALTAALGFDKPIWQQYLDWIVRLPLLDLGQSISYSAPVLEVLVGHIVPTLTLALAGTLLSFVLAVVISTWTVVKPRSLAARIVTWTTSAGIAIPDFWIALILVLIFAATLRLVPTSGYTPLFEDPLLAISQLILPVAVLMIGQTSLFTLTLRETLVGELTSLYLRTARAKGLSEFVVMTRHALPNALLPCLTVLGNNFGSLLGGIVIIETIFVVPGLGAVVSSSISSRDYPLIQGATLLIAFIFVVVNLLVDLLYAVIDPKVRTS